MARLIRSGYKFRPSGDRAEADAPPGVAGSLLDAAPQGAVALGRSGTIIYLNGAARAMFQLQSTEAIGQKIERLLPRISVQSLIDRVDGAAEAPAAAARCVLETSGRRRNGDEFRATVQLADLRSSEADLLGLFISEAGSGDSAGSALLRELAELPEVNPFPVIRVDDSGNILYSNPAARQFTERIGYSGKKITDLLPDGFLTTVRAAIAEDRTVIEDTRRVLGRILSFTYRPISQMRQVFVLIVDVTERVEAIDQCRTYAGELEETNRQLRNTQAQLIQSGKMAALGNLVAGVAHEINTPLGIVHSNNQTVNVCAAKIRRLIDESGEAGNSETFAKLLPILQTVENLGAINRDAIGRITKIVDSLRSFARLDRAEMDLVDIHEGLETTITLLQSELKRQARIHRDYGDVPHLYCYPQQLNQVFMNLLSNAAQAIETTGDIYIRTRAEAGWVIVEIEDNGQGIKDEHLQRIFDPGFTTKGVQTGVGLGLAISYRIVEDHRGLLEVASKFGEGSKFTVRLPLRPLHGDD